MVHFVEIVYQGINMKKLVVAAAILAASASVFAFQAGMTKVQINAEVAQRVSGGQSLDSILVDAKAAGVDGAVVQSSLIAAGEPSAVIFSAMVGAGFDAGALLPPTAAGGNQNAGNQNPGNGFNGANNSSFGQSRATSVGGGGRKSVSPS